MKYSCQWFLKEKELVDFLNKNNFRLVSVVQDYGQLCAILEENKKNENECSSLNGPCTKDHYFVVDASKAKTEEINDFQNKWNYAAHNISCNVQGCLACQPKSEAYKEKCFDGGEHQWGDGWAINTCLLCEIGRPAKFYKRDAEVVEEEPRQNLSEQDFNELKEEYLDKKEEVLADKQTIALMAEVVADFLWENPDFWDGPTNSVWHAANRLRKIAKELKK